MLRAACPCLLVLEELGAVLAGCCQVNQHPKGEHPCKLRLRFVEAREQNLSNLAVPDATNGARTLLGYVPRSEYALKKGGKHWPLNLATRLPANSKMRHLAASATQAFDQRLAAAFLLSFSCCLRPEQTHSRVSSEIPFKKARLRPLTGSGGGVERRAVNSWLRSSSLRTQAGMKHYRALFILSHTSSYRSLAHSPEEVNN